MLKKNAAVVGAGVVALATCIAGCAMHSGRDFDATTAQTFKNGQTSKTDVIAALGEPSSTGGNAAGSFIEYQYQTLNYGVLAAYGIGTVDDRVKLCKFIFDKKDKLTDHTCSEGAPNYSNFGK